jgi:hypothetical protein
VTADGAGERAAPAAQNQGDGGAGIEEAVFHFSSCQATRLPVGIEIKP